MLVAPARKRGIRQMLQSLGRRNRSDPLRHSGRDAGIQAMEDKLACSTVCLAGRG